MRNTNVPSAPRSTGLLQRTSITEGYYRGLEQRRPRSNSVPTVHAMDRATKSGSLRPPGELGVEQPPPQQQDADKSAPARSSNHPEEEDEHDYNRSKQGAHPNTILTQKRLQQSVMRGRKYTNLVAGEVTGTPSLVRSVCYRGVEVVFASTSKAVYAICARTRLVLQRIIETDLRLSVDTSASVPTVVTLQSHSSTGHVCVGLSNGQMRIFIPEKTDPKLICFGKYRWRPAFKIELATVFYSEAPNKKDFVYDVSLSGEGKILVYHRDQLAVFDASASPGDAMLAAPLLWTTLLSGPVVTAKIAGDGHAIAVVVRGENNDAGDKDGVHTFERDWEADGGISSPSTSSGIIYRPGPFLVHSAPVTRISFRGYGHLASNSIDDGQGNDLLLSYCDSDCTARIFGQNRWNPLTEWMTAPKTRIDWVQGITAFSLGDLESVKKPKGSSYPRSDSDHGDLYESLGKRTHFNSISQHHSTVSSNAGAWLCELSFHETNPSLRISRLTYVKRGVDDLNPTLFESVSSYLPVNSVLRDRLLHTDESVFSIDGIWPAWNPWLSGMTKIETTETLKGSAMAFLGLSAGPSAGLGGGGYFGSDNTQNLPCEIRIITSHEQTGEVVVLEVSLFGDSGMTSLELSHPVRRLLSLNHLDRYVVGSAIEKIDACGRNPGAKNRLSAGMDYDADSRLVAEIEDNHRSISITWRLPGTMSFLPSHWLPEDVHPDRAGSILENCKAILRDESMVPVPITLLNLKLSPEVAKARVRAILWWPDDSAFGSSPLILAILSDGTVKIYEVPPPWSLLEPPLPNFGKPLPPSMMIDINAISPSESFEENNGDTKCTEYEVLITPDPEYGLGLRLESHPDGRSAVAGSYKKHPLTGDPLPAEKVGKINLGDELLSANGIDLEDKPFDDIISAVREVGASSGPGNPIRMRFRCSASRLSRHGSFASIPSHKRQSSFVSESGSQRRTKEQMFGVRPNDSRKRLGKSSSNVSTGLAAEISNSTATDVLVVGSFPDLISTTSAKTVRLVLYESDPKIDDIHTRKSLVFSAANNVISVTWVSVAPKDEQLFAKASYLDSVSIPNKLEGQMSHICALYAVNAGHSMYSVTACLEDGDVHLVNVTVQPGENPKEVKAIFQSYFAFRLQNRWSPDCVLKVYSTELLISLQPGVDGQNFISIWTAKAEPGCSLDVEPSVSDGDKSLVPRYSVQQVDPEYSYTGNKILDFCILRSGFLDASPVLVTFSLKGVCFFQKQVENFDWLPISQLSYNLSAWSVSCIPASQPSAPETCFIEINENPRDSFPHLVHGTRLVLMSSAESNFIRSDWHPDSLLAHVCTDPIGAKNALNHIRKIFVWLCSEAEEGADAFLESPLIVIPTPHEHETEQSPSESLSLMDALTAPSGSDAPEVARIRDFLASILQMFLDGRGTKGSSVEPENINSLPTIVNKMEEDDLRILWALGNLVVDPPDFDSIDSTGQLFVFSSALFRKINEISKSANNTKSQHGKVVPVHSIFTRRIPSTRDNEEAPSSVSSAGALSALLCSNQGLLLLYLRKAGANVTWSFIREHRIAFWERSDFELARIAEEIGQNIYRNSRDSMECALFFIIARKQRTLRNLVATDQSDSGKTFFKFLTKHDFSSERGRAAAEKNAFSLLRKCRYQVASAFFLLAEPPSLKSALETIASKLKDIDLAFLVARLMESDQFKKRADNSTSLGIGGGILGGGGGYASSVPYHEKIIPGETTHFRDWKPRLGPETKRLLVERVLPFFVNDNVMSAISLLWLGKSEEAFWFLSGSVHGSFTGITKFSLVDDVPRRFLRALQTRKLGSTLSWRLSSQPVEKANLLMDFISSPFLLRALRAGGRARFAAALFVSKALSARGIEVSSMVTLAQFADPIELSEQENESDGGEKVERERTQVGNLSVSIPSSSIFDAYDTLPPPYKISEILPSGAPQSSIFDDFDSPVNPSINKQGADHVMTSSIFEGCDDRKTNGISKSENIQSSIFEAFDLPQQNPVTVQTAKTGATNAGSGDMQSSIFDSFDAIPNTNSALQHTTVLASRNSDVQLQKESNQEDKYTVNIPLYMQNLSVPNLWNEWRSDIIRDAAARRAVREICTTLAAFHGDPSIPFIHDFYSHDRLLVSPSVSEVLLSLCNTEDILAKVRLSLHQICTTSKLDEVSLYQCAFRLLGCNNNRRLLLAVVLNAAMNRSDVAENLVRYAANDLIQFCHSFTLSHDNLKHRKFARAHVSSLFVRREAARICWQLESCLWLHRGGGLPLSGRAVHEAIIAVRIGLLLAAWNRNFECIDEMIKTEPDCIVDDDCGRQLWMSLKMVEFIGKDTKPKKSSSGGWEFLVDCRRSQATELLRSRPTGCFIIRPHPENVGVFTLSFKTNLVPESDPEELSTDNDSQTLDTSGDDLSDADNINSRPPRPRTKKVRKDDVVQHAVVRLSESGFRCGSFGPFTSLMHLLEAVSSSLPFKLRFDLPLKNRISNEKGKQTSPNAVLLRKLTLHGDDSVSHPPFIDDFYSDLCIDHFVDDYSKVHPANEYLSTKEQVDCLGSFLELLVLSSIRRQLCGVACAIYDDYFSDKEELDNSVSQSDPDKTESEDGESSDSIEFGHQSHFAVATRMLGPFLAWCRSLETLMVQMISPELNFTHRRPQSFGDTSSHSVTESIDAIEVAPIQAVKFLDGGDSILQGMIQRGSSVDFSTLRLVDGGECTMVVLFSKKEAIRWLLDNGIESSKERAVLRLEKMEKNREIEPVDLSKLPLKQKSVDAIDEGVRYRFVDPWEVEAVSDREGETRSASLGRGSFVTFSLGQISSSTERVLRGLGGTLLLELWASAKGGIALTKALASVHPPWERSGGGDLQLVNGTVTEPAPYLNSIRQSLYRNSLFRRLSLPQRFVTLIQVELLDLKNLTTPGGSLSMTTYALLRLKRKGSSASLTNKARTLDSAATPPVKLHKTSSGPNAPASWGSVVRFRFPLPEDVAVDGTSYDKARESLFRGPPLVLQMSVYEKKLLVDHSLGTADIGTDGLGAGGQLEEWVPLRCEKNGKSITWFARVRLTLRFELMCLATEKDVAPSVGLQRIDELMKAGGSVHEDVPTVSSKSPKRSMSQPDLMGYFENWT